MERPLRKTNTSQYYKSVEKIRYGEDFENEDDSKDQME